MQILTKKSKNTLKIINNDKNEMHLILDTLSIPMTEQEAIKHEKEIFWLLEFKLIRVNTGTPYRTRTYDLILKRDLLYQLS